MKLNRRQLRNLILEVLTDKSSINESISDLGFVNRNMLNLGLSQITNPVHVEKIKDFINNELRITDEKFKIISGLRETLRPLYDKYVKDSDIDSFISGLREKLAAYLV